MAANPIIAPEEEIVFEEKALKVHQPKLTPKAVGPKQRVKDILVKIFEGREEFLGWTPD
ncbi:MAG: hypothetical protein WAL52_12835 [Candidatus Sulfotelmatobacter sp.]